MKYETKWLSFKYGYDIIKAQKQTISNKYREGLRLINNQRQREIINIISRKGNVTVEELAKTFDVSKMTIRRDLEKLQENNLLQRTHGGALVNKVLLHEMAYHEKRSEYAESKHCIAKEAIGHIEPKSTIFLDAGTTMFELANLITQNDLTIITNDIRIAQHLMLTDNQVIFLGGQILKETGSTTDSQAQAALQNFNIDIAFIGTSGVDKDLNLCTPEINRMRMKQLAIENAAKRILVTDHSKFFRKALYKIVPLSTFDTVITDLDEEKLENTDLKDTEFVSLLCPITKELTHD